MKNVAAAVTVAKPINVKYARKDIVWSIRTVSKFVVVGKGAAKRYFKIVKGYVYL